MASESVFIVQVGLHQQFFLHLRHLHVVLSVLLGGLAVLLPDVLQVLVNHLLSQLCLLVTHFVLQRLDLLPLQRETAQLSVCYLERRVAEVGWRFCLAAGCYLVPVRRVLFVVQVFAPLDQIVYLVVKLFVFEVL